MHLSFNYTPNDIANWFICNIDREAGDSITHLKLQKLIYYAQAWSLTIYEKSLFPDEFEAWTHGPVIPSLYNEYKRYGYDAIPACDCDISINEEVEKLLKDVQDIYGQKSGKYLEELTHEEPPWRLARKGHAPEERCTNKITKDSMVNYYSTLLKK